MNLSTFYTRNDNHIHPYHRGRYSKYGSIIRTKPDKSKDAQQRNVIQAL